MLFISKQTNHWIDLINWQAYSEVCTFPLEDFGWNANYRSKLAQEQWEIPGLEWFLQEQTVTLLCLLRYYADSCFSNSVQGTPCEIYLAASDILKILYLNIYNF